jgi:transposase-like protein
LALAENIVESVGRYVTEEDCYSILETERWPDALTCIRCGHKSVRRLELQRGRGAHRRVFQCNHCRYQFSSTTGTIFHHSRVPLLKWFVGIYLLSSNSKLSAVELQNSLHITYKAAWRLRKAAHADFLGLEDYFGSEKSDINEVGNPVEAVEKEPRRMGRKIPLVSMIHKFARRIPDAIRKDLTLSGFSR